MMIGHAPSPRPTEGKADRYIAASSPSSRALESMSSALLMLAAAMAAAQHVHTLHSPPPPARRVEALAAATGTGTGTGSGSATCAAAFELYLNTTCNQGNTLRTLHLTDSPACCAACSAEPKCLAWTWKNGTDDQGHAHPECRLEANPGTFSPGHDAPGSTCGVYRDTPPGPQCTVCMKLYPNQTVSTSGDSYLQLQTNTSDGCCARCTADSGRCISWRWTQLQYGLRGGGGGLGREIPEGLDDWHNCELFQGELQSFQNVSNGRPMLTGVMLGARHGYNPPPSPPLDKDGYLGCFVSI
jgi:hypothetical protein